MYPPPSSELTVEQQSEQKSIQNNNNNNQKAYQQGSNNQNRKRNQMFSTSVNSVANNPQNVPIGVQNRRKNYNTLPKVKLNVPQSRASSTENLSGHQQQQQPQQQQQQQLTLNINGGPIQSESPTSPSYSMDYLYQLRCHMTPAGQNLSPIHYESPRFQLQQQRIGEHNFFNGQNNGKDGRFFNNFHQHHQQAYHPNNNYHNNNRNHQYMGKKNQWNWNQQHAKKINNNNNNTKQTNNNPTTTTTTTTTTDNKPVTISVTDSNHTAATTTRAIVNNNKNKPQPPSNTTYQKHYQNHENLTFIRTSESSHSVKNSRSPTPSPKSESPPTTADRDGSSSTIFSLETTPPLIESPNLTGYDSDSSHSSYRPEYFYYRNPIHQSYQLVDPTTYNLHDINEDPRGFGMYSSHQNLLMWNQHHAAGNGVYPNCDFAGMRFNSVSADNVNQPKKR